MSAGPEGRFSPRSLPALSAALGGWREGRQFIYLSSTHGAHHRQLRRSVRDFHGEPARRGHGSAPLGRESVAERNVDATEQVLGASAVPLTSSESCGGAAYQLPGNVYGAGRVDALSATLSQGPSGIPPAVTITEPANGATFDCPANITMTGVASDYEDGDLSSRIAWQDGTTPIGTGGTISRLYACTDIGLHDILASAADSAGLTDSDSVQIRIRAACFPSGSSCTANSHCCSGRCALSKGRRKCK